MQKTSLLLLLLCLSLCFVDARSKSESKRMIRGHVQNLRNIKFGHMSGGDDVSKNALSKAKVANFDDKAAKAVTASGDDDEGEGDDEEMYTQTPNTVW